MTKHIGTYGFPEWLCVKNLPAMHETQVPTLGQECPLEKEMATHSCILVWGLPWTEEFGRLQSVGLQSMGMTEHVYMLEY